MLSRPRPSWSALFCATLWHIRLDGNALCFQQLSNLYLIPSKSFAFAAEFWSLLPHSIPKSVCSFIPVKWLPPKSTRIKLNFDGSSKVNPGMSGAGGVLRDEYGTWIVGFAKNLGHGSSNTVEFWGIKTGLRNALERGFTKAEVESDSLFAVSTLNNKYVAKRSHGLIVTL